MIKKTDQSKHRICISKIKRTTIKPYNAFEWTKLYEDNQSFLNTYPDIHVELNDEELLICSTIIDSNNYSILTTQKLITSENGVLESGLIIHAKNELYGNFKGHGNEKLTFGKIIIEHGKIIKYFIETGKASMIMIYGVKTLIQIKESSLSAPQQ
ncbi:hypothetical protein [Chryseobacterium sp. JV274]|uniref:hypothetical protein n=1 Tax=Chryseobacterium sp. JV274 TaxID=1932669 RepID=UPI0015C1DF91|nr:hypothetical protein [Chryseobacterium sp. JV274]CAD0221366.1 conserved protein of unknown function [Chryseobacterium sp. JV274]